MYRPDLDTSTMVDSGMHIRAIGWISDSFPYAQGEVPEAVVRKLRELVQRCSASSYALRWPAFGGRHCCELCDDFSTEGNLAVPAGDLLYVAPEMVSHYVEVHRYLPPQEFQEAVLTSPLPGTEEFDSAVAGFRELYRLKMAPLYSGLMAYDEGGDEAAVRNAALEHFGKATEEVLNIVRERLERVRRMKEPSMEEDVE